MKQEQVSNITKLSAEINNFRDCYKSCKLYSSPPDGDVRVETILEWLTENPHMAEIAIEISKLEGVVKRSIFPTT